jgi:guanylate kinase
MENHLEHLAEFQEILANYHIAPAGTEVLRDARLVLFIGATATGRDTIIAELIKTGDYYHIASDTTRQPRVNNGVPEQNGVEYWFRSEEEFLADLRAGKLLEAEIIHDQHVSGISIRELSKAYEQGKIAITNVDLNIHTIVEAKPDTKAFMVLPPSFTEWMRRLDYRGKMSPDEKRRRLKTACRVFEAALEYDYFILITNDTVARATAEINQVVKTGKTDPKQRAKTKDLAKQLLADTNNWLKTP